MKRRPRVRSATAECGGCRTRLTVEIPPVVYVRHLMGRPEDAEAWRMSCACGGELVITYGDARRAA